jgi:hypothetical protein
MKFQKTRKWVFDCLSFLEGDRRRVRLGLLKEKKSRRLSGFQLPKNSS